MNVLVIGSGGREHAICYNISTSPLLSNLYAIPGNPGIAEIADIVFSRHSRQLALFPYFPRFPQNLNY